MSDLTKIWSLHEQEHKAEGENNDFIDAHNTMMKRPDKYKIDYFPVNGQELREMREALLLGCLETQCELE